MAIITMYATGAGHYHSKQTSDGTTNTPSNRTDAVTSSEDVFSGGTASGQEADTERDAYWTWLGASFASINNEIAAGATINSITLVLNCKTGGTHSHPVQKLNANPKNYPDPNSPAFPPRSSVIANYDSAGESSIDVTTEVAGWITNPSTAYGFATDMVPPPAQNPDIHTFEGYDTARVVIDYTPGNSQPNTPTNVTANPNPVAKGDSFQLSWTYSDPDGDPQSHYQLRWMEV